MSNTKPEVRVNKLGVPVTKHVLIDPKVKLAAKSLPLVSPVKTPPKAATAQQLMNKDTLLSSRLFRADDRLFDLLDKKEGATFSFNASESEIFSVMSVTGAGNAFALLEMGMRTADEATDHLYEIGAADLLHDRSELMQELMARGVPYDKTAYVLQEVFDPEQADASPFCADALEFYAWEGSVGVENRRELCTDIIEGRVRLDDLKEIGMDKLNTSERVKAVTDSLKKFSARKRKPYKLADMSKLLDIATRDKIESDDIDTTVMLLEKVGIKGIEKLDDAYRFTQQYWELSDTDGVVKDAVEASYYAALVSEGMERAGMKRDYSYLGQTFPYEVITLRKNKISVEYATALLRTGLTAEQAVEYVKVLDAEGVSSEQALPLIYDGKTAHEITGIHSGVNANLADGWV